MMRGGNDNLKSCRKMQSTEGLLHEEERTLYLTQVNNTRTLLNVYCLHVHPFLCS